LYDDEGFMMDEGIVAPCAGWAFTFFLDKKNKETCLTVGRKIKAYQTQVSIYVQSLRAAEGSLRASRSY
jgi:hypothetical protein